MAYQVEFRKTNAVAANIVQRINAGGEVNQNAFSSVAAGDLVVTADQKMDMLQLRKANDNSVVRIDADTEEVVLGYAHTEVSEVQPGAYAVGRTKEGHTLIGEKIDASDIGAVATVDVEGMMPVRGMVVGNVDLVMAAATLPDGTVYLKIE